MTKKARSLCSQTLLIFVIALLLAVRPSTSFSPSRGISVNISPLVSIQYYNDQFLPRMQSNNDDDDGWESVPKKQPRRKNKPRDEQQDDGSLPWISFTPPTPENTQFAPFMLLLCGIPGCGKSTFAKSLQKAMPYKYVRINQDDLGNRRRCEELTRAALANGQCPVIDRCNFDQDQRAKFVAIARDEYNNTVPVDCVVLVAERLMSVEECIQRCQKRKNHPTIAARDARNVVMGMARQMKAPVIANQEGIRDVRYITDRNAFNDAIVEYLNRNV